MAWSDLYDLITIQNHYHTWFIYFALAVLNWKYHMDGNQTSLRVISRSVITGVRDSNAARIWWWMGIDSLQLRRFQDTRTKKTTKNNNEWLNMNLPTYGFSWLGCQLSVAFRFCSSEAECQHASLAPTVHAALIKSPSIVLLINYTSI